MRHMLLGLGVTLAACSADQVDPGSRAAQRPMASMQRLRAGSGESGTTYLGMHFLATDDGGASYACEDGTLDVTVSWKGEDGTWHELSDGSVALQCADGAGGDLALVVDNSGSVDGYIDELREGATIMTEGVLSDAGRASVVRVSTDSKVVTGITGDEEELADALASLYIANGWTALWDGVRMGNETLGLARIADDEEVVFEDMVQFCQNNEPLGIVAFTDGQENNSDSSQTYDKIRFPGDGYDTTLEDLYNLKLGSMSTPIYTIGMGHEPDHATLQALAEGTGGRHHAIADETEIVDVYAEIGHYFSSTQQVCAEIPERACGDLAIQVAYSWEVDGERFEASEEFTVYVECPIEPDWRTVTILLTMENDPGLGDTVAGKLATQAIQWASGMVNPRVLVILDDNHHNENKSDGEYVQGLLQAAGLDADFMNEPSDGISLSTLDGYDAVWFTNPGYPMDDIATMYALAEYADIGGGLVLQGDDISWSNGHAFDMSDLTHLQYVANGTKYCGYKIDNNNGETQYKVTLGGTHPVLDGIDSTSYLYGNDIDTTQFLDHKGASTIATANVPAAGDSCEDVPAMVAYDPP